MVLAKVIWEMPVKWPSFHEDFHLGAWTMDFDLTFSALEGDRPLGISDFRGKNLLLIQFASW